MTKPVRKKRVEQGRAIGKDLAPIETENAICSLCKEDYLIQAALVIHCSKFHKNEYLFHCEKCGKGFMSKLGYNLNMGVHDEAKRLVTLKMVLIRHLDQICFLKAYGGTTPN